ncbi:Chaperone protein HtpG [Bdellovibrio bacteriovorus]|uniref:molecular chaperone HtpG n=1 Tax=Bdellovibrio bacteriovorus TaxID=959 RepID=UPI00045C0284|nr:molecular chaperone HtpG [Bdellovibrio bacteriovorus]AHZ84320.1 heat shock protein 90 [Bdellovibrio bacteriovorus]BEV68208.1 Chaperone protein HtpG [Bdellovibrio bacteriovorus]
MAKQVQNFNAEIKQLLDIVIHSLYSHKEIFLRELLSNASDAIDKLKFNSLTHPSLLPENWQPAIRLEPNSETKTLKIIDNGIGMTQEEVVEFIGTIARSGAKAFMQMNAEMKTKPELIGQFGVGFYSAFMVADRVTLHTQKAGSNDGTVWESMGDGTYSLDNVPRPEGTGTTITLHMKDFKEEDEVQNFTDKWVLKSLVKKYSDFIAHPIKMMGETEEETLNSQKALWLKSPSDVTKEEYKEFYQHLTHDWNEPLRTVHYRAEGTMEFNALLYIPGKKPWNYNMRDMEYGLSLYIKRVFIMADCKDLLPPYLRFVKGLVDSSDLSLNVSRELLQQDRQVTQIRKNVTNKALSTLKDLLTKERSAYEDFWTEFGATLKEGLPSDAANKEKLQDLLLFHSTSSDKMTTMDEYVARMKETQKDIYYITGDSLSQVSNSPYLEKLKEKGFEVLLLVDPVDEWVVDALSEFKGKKLQSIMREGLDLDTAEEKQQKEQEKKQAEVTLKPVLESMKKTLESDVKDVVLSDRLTNTPACLVASSADPSAHMQKLMAQMGKEYAGQQVKRIMEINPNHPVFEKMLKASPEQQTKWAEILYAQALLTEGSNLPDPVKFSQQIAELMVQAADSTKH